MKKAPTHRHVKKMHAVYGFLALVVAIEGMSLILSNDYSPFSASIGNQVTVISEPKVFVDKSGFVMQYPQSWGAPKQRLTQDGVEQVQFGLPVTVLHVPLLDDSTHHILSVDEAINKHLPGSIETKETVKFNGMNATKITYNDSTNRYAIVVTPTRSTSHDLFVIHVHPASNDVDNKVINRALETFALLRT